MDPYELELKRALEKRAPGDEFTSSVMARVREEAAGQRAEPKVEEMPTRRRGVWKWATIGAVAASLAIGVMVEQERSQRRQAELAEAQLYETLLLTGQKISEARAQVIGATRQGEVR